MAQLDTLANLNSLPCVQDRVLQRAISILNAAPNILSAPDSGDFAGHEKPAALFATNLGDANNAFTTAYVTNLGTTAVPVTQAWFTTINSRADPVTNLYSTSVYVATVFPVTTGQAIIWKQDQTSTSIVIACFQGPTQTGQDNDAIYNCYEQYSDGAAQVETARTVVTMTTAAAGSEVSQYSVQVQGGGSLVDSYMATQTGITFPAGNYETFPEISTPSTPASGHVAIYPKSDGNMYQLDDTGAESLIGASAVGGNGCLIDSTAMGQTDGADVTCAASGVTLSDTGTLRRHFIGDLTSTGDFRWQASGSGTDEYFLQEASGNAPTTADGWSMGTPVFAGQFTKLTEDGTPLVRGTAGSLATGEFDVADNDSLGYDTIYARLSDGTDPDSKSAGYLKVGGTYSNDFGMSGLYIWPDTGVGDARLETTAAGFREMILSMNDSWSIDVAWLDQSSGAGSGVLFSIGTASQQTLTVTLKSSGELEIDWTSGDLTAGQHQSQETVGAGANVRNFITFVHHGGSGKVAYFINGAEGANSPLLLDEDGGTADFAAQADLLAIGAHPGGGSTVNVDGAALAHFRMRPEAVTWRDHYDFFNEFDGPGRVLSFSMTAKDSLNKLTIKPADDLDGDHQLTYSLDSDYTHTYTGNTSTNQDVTTTGTPQFAGIELGHVSDTTLARSSAGNVSIEGNVIYRAGGTDVAVADGGTGTSGPSADNEIFVGTGAGTGAWESGATLRTSIGVREKLTANRTYYVDATDGDDGNDGLSAGSGGAFQTVQKAIDVAVALDLDIYAVTIQLADDTYTAGGTLKPYVGTGPITIQGNNSTPDNVLVSVTSGNCFSGIDAGSWVVKDMKLVTTTSGSGLVASGRTRIKSNIVNMGAIATYGMLATYTGIIEIIGSYTISGNIWQHYRCENGGVIECAGAHTITVSGTPAIASVFAYAPQTGLIYFVNGPSFSGSATGKTYISELNSVINTSGGGASFFPGDVAGTTATGGQYQ